MLTREEIRTLALESKDRQGLTWPQVGQAIEPFLYGRSMGLSAVAVVVAAVFWTWLWGPVGLLLSTPLTTPLAVVPIFVNAGAAVLPTLIAGLGTFVAVLLKPKELLTLFRRKPWLPVAIFLIVADIVVLAVRRTKAFNASMIADPLAFFLVYVLYSATSLRWYYELIVISTLATWMLRMLNPATHDRSPRLVPQDVQ